MSNAMTELYNISRKITKSDGTKYTYIAEHYGYDNYRLISSGELNIRGKDIEVPRYVRDFVSTQGEVLLIGGLIRNQAYGIIMRGLKEKVFSNYGFGKGTFYGLGDLEPDFKYGDLIVLVEGAIDRDVCKTFVTRNCLSVMTSSLTNNQIQVLSCLTNKVLLILDNDTAGRNGEKSSKSKLTTNGITTYQMVKPDIVKDFGDVLELKMKNDPRADILINTYRNAVLTHGGKLCKL